MPPLRLWARKERERTGRDLLMSDSPAPGRPEPLLPGQRFTDLPRGVRNQPHWRWIYGDLLASAFDGAIIAGVAGSVLGGPIGAIAGGVVGAAAATVAARAIKLRTKPSNTENVPG